MNWMHFVGFTASVALIYCQITLLLELFWLVVERPEQRKEDLQ